MPCAPTLQRTARRQVQQQDTDTFAVTLRLKIESRPPSEVTSERGWIVVFHDSTIGEYWGAIVEAVEGAAQDFPPLARLYSM
jgi:hypothetical protein